MSCQKERGVTASLFALDGYPSLLGDAHADSKSGRVLTNALLAAYLPGLQGSADTFVGARRPCPPRLAPLPGSQTVTDKQGLPMPVNGNANNYTLQYGVQNSNTDASGVALVERLVEGATITATISGNGNQIINVSSGSQKTNANGEAVFAIDAKGKKGTAVIRFRASGLGKSTTAQVKVR